MTLSNLSAAKPINSSTKPANTAQRPIEGRMFSHILDDVTFIPDPSLAKSSQAKKEKEEAIVIQKPRPEEWEEAKQSLRMATYPEPSKPEKQPSSSSKSNSFDIVDAVSQSVSISSASKNAGGVKTSMASKESKGSGSKENAQNLDLSDRIKSAVSESVGIPGENSNSFSIS